MYPVRLFLDLNDVVSEEDASHSFQGNIDSIGTIRNRSFVEIVALGPAVLRLDFAREERR